MGEARLLREISDYNEVDCRSTLLLRDWLLSLRPSAVSWYDAITVEEPDPEREERRSQAEELFFLYLGYLALVGAFDDPTRGARAGAILALVGAVNLPIIKFSVDWWNTLHQPASVFRLGGPTIALSMLLPLLVMAVAFTALFFTVWLIRIRTAILARRIAALRLAAAEPDRFDLARGGVTEPASS